MRSSAGGLRAKLIQADRFTRGRASCATVGGCAPRGLARCDGGRRSHETAFQRSSRRSPTMKWHERLAEAA